MIGAWRNKRFSFYMQVCYLDECNEKLQAALEKHGRIFDNDFCYRVAASDNPRKAIIRTPMWMGFTTKEPIEPVEEHHFDNYQRKLDETIGR